MTTLNPDICRCGLPYSNCILCKPGTRVTDKLPPPEPEWSACCGRYPVSRPGAVCQDGAGCKKPHLRLRYEAAPAGQPPLMSPWSVEYVRGPLKRLRRETFQHTTSMAALWAAREFWF